MLVLMVNVLYLISVCKFQTKCKLRTNKRNVYSNHTDTVKIALFPFPIQNFKSLYFDISSALSLHTCWIWQFLYKYTTNRGILTDR